MTRSLRAAIAAVALAATLVAAAPARAAAAETRPATGWRGDGTGKYPAADPPRTWSRISLAVKGLRFLASKPAADAAGAEMPDGVVREWLVLGPVPVSEDADIKDDALPDEADLEPEENEKAGDRTWKRVTLQTAYLDFAALLGGRGAESAVAYAFTRVHSETGGPLRLNLTTVGPARVYVNGKAAAPFVGRLRLNLAKGWNRVLLKVAPGEADWYAVPVLHGWVPAEYAEAGIAWRTALPGAAPGFYGGGMGVAAPVVVGDRLYVLCEPNDLVCLDKADGKVRWVRRSGYLEAADAEDRKQPAFQEAEALGARLDALAASLVAGTATPQEFEEKAKVEKALAKAMAQVSPEKYKPSEVPDVGWSGFTPTTDGRFVWVWSATGVTACYDLDGGRRWIRVDRRPAVEHGFSSSPLLVDGKVVAFLRDLLAFDAATGATAWITPLVSHKGLNPGGFFHGSPVAVRIGEADLIALGNGTIVRAADGKVLRTDPAVSNQAVASPVVEGRTLLGLPSWGMVLLVYALPDALADPLVLTARKIDVDTAGFPKHYLPWYLASPVVHEGLAYLVNNAGVLTVVDLEAGKVVYQRMLDLDPFQAHNEGAARGIGASPALAGGLIYILGNNGAALVLAPGRTYKQVAKNKIESVVQVGHWSERQERFVAHPVFDGRRLYLRGEGHLWAVGPR